jgi:hypothetical protein
MVIMEQGMLARTLAGHDRKKIFIIIRADAEYVWLADGRFRTLEHPKKKKKKHIQVIHRIPEVLVKTLSKGEPLQNEHIIQAIQSESRDRQEEKDVESRCN